MHARPRLLWQLHAPRQLPPATLRPACFTACTSHLAAAASPWSPPRRWSGMLSLCRRPRPPPPPPPELPLQLQHPPGAAASAWPSWRCPRCGRSPSSSSPRSCCWRNARTRPGATSRPMPRYLLRECGRRVSCAVPRVCHVRTVPVPGVCVPGTVRVPFLVPPRVGRDVRCVGRDVRCVVQQYDVCRMVHVPCSVGYGCVLSSRCWVAWGTHARIPTRARTRKHTQCLLAPT